PYGLEFPGAIDEPGHRDIPMESHYGPTQYQIARYHAPSALIDHADPNPLNPFVTYTRDGVPTIAYNFQTIYGTHPVTGESLENVISETQKQRAREIFE